MFIGAGEALMAISWSKFLATHALDPMVGHPGLSGNAPAYSQSSRLPDSYPLSSPSPLSGGPTEGSSFHITPTRTGLGVH